MEMECLDFRFYYKKMMSLESSRVNVGNIYLLLTVCVILYIGRMLFKNKTETKSFETFDDIKIKTCPYLVKTLHSKSSEVFEKTILRSLQYS